MLYMFVPTSCWSSDPGQCLNAVPQKGWRCPDQSPSPIASADPFRVRTNARAGRHLGRRVL